MSNKKVPQDFIELEHYFSKYFDAHIAPLADKAVKDADASYLKEYGSLVSDSGLLGAVTLSGPRAAAAVAKSQSLDSYQNYWSNIQKSFQKRFESSSDFKADFGKLIDAYQKAMIDKMGKEQYMAESRKYGQDLATWYVNNKILEKSLNRMAAHGAPKDSVEYLFQKGKQLSILGLTQPSDWDGMRALQEQQYKPSKTEKMAAYGVGGLMDFAVMPVGGMKTAIIGTTAGAGIDIVFSSGNNRQNVDALVSRSVFGNSWTLPETRKELVDAKDSDYLTALNAGMKKKVTLTNPSPALKQIAENNRFPLKGTFLTETDDRDDIPMIVAPGMEEAYRRDLARLKQETPKPVKPQKKAEPIPAPTPHQTTVNSPSSAELNSYQQNYQYQPQRVNNNGWGGLFDSVGLTGFSDVFKNLGYVLAMLPDMMIGMFTGKTKSLSVQQNLLPIAAIVMGMFVRNPLLKMLLIGLGGANLLNKATHEILGETPSAKEVRYRPYADERLNARISHPQLNGNLLVATIDGVPSTVTLQESVVDAYQKGALPINTIANAVLAKYDEQRMEVEQNYERQMAESEHREISRGIR
ncbi:MAG: hypothetical protein E7107_04445 [Prevotella sp.]|nr:hypothetical protein [Prevotella sp.]